MTTTEPQIPVEAQVEALAKLKVYDLVAAHGHRSVDPRPFLTVTRRQIVDFFTRHPDVAEAHLTLHPADRPFHDHLCIERRGQRFSVFDMYRGRMMEEHFYDSLAEAAADFVAWTYGYGYKPSA
jgi:hypothetical protein